MFFECRPISYFILSRLGIDTESFPFGHSKGIPVTYYCDIKMLCIGNRLLEKLEYDKDFCEKSRKGELVQAKKPTP